MGFCPALVGGVSDGSIHHGSELVSVVLVCPIVGGVLVGVKGMRVLGVLDGVGVAVKSGLVLRRILVECPPEFGVHGGGCASSNFLFFPFKKNSQNFIFDFFLF